MYVYPKEIEVSRYCIKYKSGWMVALHSEDLAEAKEEAVEHAKAIQHKGCMTLIAVATDYKMAYKPSDEQDWESINE